MKSESCLVHYSRSQHFSDQIWSEKGAKLLLLLLLKIKKEMLPEFNIQAE